MPSTSPTVRRRRLGLILRDLRIQAELTCDEVGKELERSNSWVSRIETGRNALRARDLRDLLDLYRVEDPTLRAELESLARDGKQRGWWNRYGHSLSGPYATYIGFETEAQTLSNYNALVIPGLLQTEEYAKTLLRCGVPPESAVAAERVVKIRMTRQRRLTGDRPIQLNAIVDESVLRRAFGDPPMLHRQLERLLEAVELPHVSIQVHPLAQAINPGMIASFSVLEFPPPDQPIAFTEGLTGQIIEEETEAARYTMVFNELRSAALSKADSITMIQKVTRELA